MYSKIHYLKDTPISLNYGYIGRFEIRIPWSNLGVDPVMIIIDKINLLIEPKYEWDPGKYFLYSKKDQSLIINTICDHFNRSL